MPQIINTNLLAAYQAQEQKAKAQMLKANGELAKENKVTIKLGFTTDFDVI